MILRFCLRRIFIRLILGQWRRAPNGRLVILKGANHMVFASNPQDVLRESLSFADFLPP